MKTANGTELRLSEATAYVLRNILQEWINERTPLEDYLKARYFDYEPKFVEFKRAALEERITRMRAVIEQLEE